jgi:TonB family protein
MKRMDLNKLLTFKSINFIAILLLSVNFISCSNNENGTSGRNDSSESKIQNELSHLQSEEDSALINNPVNGIYESFALDEKPSFPGGDDGLTSYLAKHTVYPREAKNRGIEGKVYVRFVVTKSGKIGEADVMRTVDALLEMEAIRVVKSLPKWTPGKKNGKPVDVWLIIPIDFRLK